MIYMKESNEQREVGTDSLIITGILSHSIWLTQLKALEQKYMKRESKPRKQISLSGK